MSQSAADESSHLESTEWIDSLAAVLQSAGPERCRELLQQLAAWMTGCGLEPPFSTNTPYINTIPVAREPAYPGDWALEERIRHILRWNAMAMVVRANRAEEGIGGHIATYASAATLLEVGFHHFFRAPREQFEGDLLYLQGHCAPGIYARSLLEGRLTEHDVANFRRELRPEGGLSSYPHPWLMPDYWQFPTVSMGLSPIMAIYQARYMRYLEDRGLKPHSDAKIWAFLGDGETDEPETLGAITLAAREKLDNLIFVVNCNLQRLDGPVRGNGKIIQELEAAFRGAGWNVIKTIWGRRWDPLFARDDNGLLVQRLGAIVDGQYQHYRAGGPTAGPQYIRDHLFGAHPALAAMVADLSNEQIWKLNRGGHDPGKVYAAYHAATTHTDQPTVILAKTIKGYGLGPGGEAKNVTHQQKKLTEAELFLFRDRFEIPLTDAQIRDTSFYLPPADSPEIRYLRDRRAALGGFLPKRHTCQIALPQPPAELYTEFLHGSDDRSLSTTMALVRVIAKLLRDPAIGPRIVPIVPDEARTFGMDALFREVGIYSHVGQLYEPVDAKSLLYYRESRDGQILEEGISEAGAMSSFIAAGTAHTNYGAPTIPFFLFYSMFGLQRIGDLIWAAADMRTRGFLVGATAGRTTLAGEGLQHQDGQSHLLAYPTPNLRCYDPAFAYEIAVIVRDGLRRMYDQREDIFYYLTVANENYAMPPMPADCEAGILRGLYRFSHAPTFPTAAPTAQLIGSGSILPEAIKAQTLLAEHYGVAAAVWSATSYKALYRDACDSERWNWLHPTETPRQSHVAEQLAQTDGLCVAASDYVKALPESIARFANRPWISLGTDGFGRSDGRAALRDHFEVDARHIVYATLSGLFRQGMITADVVRDAQRRYDINPDKANPAVA